MKKIYRVEGMHCASCVANVEKALLKISGVKAAIANLPLENVSLEFTEQVPEKRLKKAVSKAGFQLLPEDNDVMGTRQRDLKRWQVRLVIQAVLGIPLLIYAMWHMFISSAIEDHFSMLLQFFLATPIVISGYHFYTTGFKALISRNPNMDSLVALGTGAAYIYSLISAANIIYGLSFTGFDKLYFESAGVILLFITLGRYLEARAKGKTVEAIAQLTAVAPSVGWVKRNGDWRQVPAGEILVGDLVQVRPGGKVPVDGIVVEGSSHVDESAITGETLPARKTIGNRVTGATINTTGAFVFRAESVGSDTVFAQIIRMVREAQSTKAPIQQLADRIAAVFVPVVLLLAILGAVSWYILGETGVFQLDNSLVFAMNIFISVLIIACPCALGLATPTAIVVGTGMGAKKGIHFKSAESLQRFSEMNIMVFDKTGTLTKGRAVVTDIENGDDESLFHQIIFALESSSEHHLAAAICNYFADKQIDQIALEMFDSVPGRGVTGSFQGTSVYAGSSVFMDESGVIIPETALQIAANLKLQGKTVIHAGHGKNWLGLLGIADEVRPEAERMVYDLQQQGIDLWMLTGDHQQTAETVGRQLGIKNLMAEVLPADKADKISELKQKGVVAMVGDGINDAPALASADIGVSISSGTDIAIETSDLVLMRPDLTGICEAFTLSHNVVRKIKQNLFWAFFYNTVSIPVALGILFPFTGYLLNPMLAGAAMAFSSVTVVSNTLLLKKM
ncbi:MAG: copper-translocating P-type ATPase [FCB group bacterium]|nr:copper-translocating P-type ATPase [FCB group bacterium]